MYAADALDEYYPYDTSCNTSNAGGTAYSLCSIDSVCGYKVVPDSVFESPPLDFVRYGLYLGIGMR